MTVTEPPASRSSELERQLLHCRSKKAGPTLICVGGLHGNEPAGVRALERVVATLDSDAALARGELLGLAGNLQALSLGKRFVDGDLNREWTPERVEQVRSGVQKRAEDHEMRELLIALEAALTARRGPVLVLDLHTTSGESPPFAIIADTLHHRRLARSLPLPLILGLEERLPDTFLEYVWRLGISGLAVEGGQHDAESSVDYLEAAVWFILERHGLLPQPLIERALEARRLLLRVSRSTPRMVEIRYLHPLTAGFRMRPGFVSFQTVRRGEPLADDEVGAIVAPRSGRILMPLYQKQGNDGFFLIRPYGRTRSLLSTTLRRLRFERWLLRLPGIEPANPPDPEEANTEVLQLSRRWQHGLVRKLLRLLGFRRRGLVGSWLRVGRKNQSGPRLAADGPSTPED